MNWPGEIWQRITNLFRREQFSHDLSEEMRLHKEMRERELREAGASGDEARFAAHRRFGNELKLREESREMWGWRWVDGLARDLRYSTRMLRKNPGFTVVAVLTLALGIGANTAIFSVLESVLWKPLPFPDSERLTSLRWMNKTGREVGFSISEYIELHASNRSFESMCAYLWPRYHNLTSNGGTERVLLAAVSHDFFDTFQVRPAVGRAFLPEEESAGLNHAAILSRKEWEKIYGVGATLAGQTIVLDDVDYAVVGIAPATLHFEYMEDPDVFVPLELNSALPMSGTAEALETVGRLRPGVSLASAQKEMEALAERLQKEAPRMDGAFRMAVENLRDIYFEFQQRSLFFFAGAVGLVLIVACVNVAALSLARMMARQREFAIRAALGAGRSILARQSLVESLLLGLIGGGLGTLVAAWSLQGLAAFLPPDYFTRSTHFGIDSRVLAFTLFISIATGLLSGVAPALFATRTNLNRDLSSGSRAVSGSAKQRRARSVLVVAEIAVALVLLFGAGLFVESFKRLSEAPLGFEPNGILAMRMLLRGPRYQQPEQAKIFYQQLLDRVRAIPGMRDAALASNIPMEGSYDAQYSIVGRPAKPNGEEPSSLVRTVTPNYFRILKTRLLAGREFTDADQENTQRTALINENFARHIFGEEDPVGQELELWSNHGSGPVRDRIRVQIVGVTENTHAFGAEEIDFDDVFLPSMQQPFKSMYLIVKPDLPFGIALDEIRGQVRSLDSQVAIYDVATMEERVEKSVKGAKFNAFLIGVFAAMAIVLVSAGISGAVAYFVQQRTQEFGIRLALGAAPSRILWHAIWQAAALGAVGLVLGVLLSLALGQILRGQLYMVPHVHMGMLYGVGIHDPAMLAGVCLLLASIVLIASYIPARRATKVDPIIALRYE
jgi:predicted permease